MVKNTKVTNYIILIFPGIFAYLNYLVPCKREHIVNVLIEGLKRLEYRGYDSTGKFLHYL